MPTTIDPTALAPAQGFVIEGTGAVASYGEAGDVNGDGFGDLIFGAPTASDGDGAVYVVFGASNGRGDVNLASLGASGVAFAGLHRTTPGFFFHGTATGSSVSQAGDVNGDGFDDIVFGAPGQGGNGNDELGAVYVIYGGEDFAAVDLSAVTAAQGSVVMGREIDIDGAMTGERLGTRVVSSGEEYQGFSTVFIEQRSVGGTRNEGVGTYRGSPDGLHQTAFESAPGIGRTPIGDINGDGLSDVVLENSRNPAEIGGILRVRDLSDIHGVGDVNGDGFDDFAGWFEGASYVHLGRSTFPAALRIVDITPTTGFSVTHAGVWGVGDLNGDGFADLAVFAPGGIGIYFGHAGPFSSFASGDLDLLDLVIEGATRARAAGDVNGDGLDDMVVTSGAGISVIYGSTALAGPSGDDVLDGGAEPDRLAGGWGDDTLSGYAGDDLLDGGRDDDVLYGHDGNDTLHGGYGEDRLYGGLLDDALFGDDGDDVLAGQAGNDTLGGGAGDDTMRGGTGDDSYRVDSAGDAVIELAGEGTDKVTATVDHVLAANVEILTVTGAHAGTGNALANTLYGSAQSNALSGLGADDVLRGGGGRDTLLGGDGADLLDGGVGKDTLTGGAGRDVFQFRDGDFGATRALADTITDFSRADREKIQLNLVDADAGLARNQAFAWLGSGAFTHVAGQLHYAQQGGTTYVEGDTNGDGTADFVIALTGLHALVASDFVL